MKNEKEKRKRVQKKKKAFFFFFFFFPFFYYFLSQKKKKEKMADNVYQELMSEIMSLGNHHEYGLFQETWEQRGNDWLKRTKEYLEIELASPSCTSEISKDALTIKCMQFWLVEFMSALKLPVLPENSIRPSFPSSCVLSPN
jgi:hypothetical protein